MSKWTKEDVPPVCWLRRTIDSVDRSDGDYHQTERLVLDIDFHVVRTLVFQFSYDVLEREHEFSSDRKNWFPCTQNGLEFHQKLQMEQTQ